MKGSQRRTHSTRRPGIRFFVKRSLWSQICSRDPACLPAVVEGGISANWTAIPRNSHQPLMGRRRAQD